MQVIAALLMLTPWTTSLKPQAPSRKPQAASASGQRPLIHVQRHTRSMEAWMCYLRLGGTGGDRPIGARYNATAAVVSASSHAVFVVFALMLVRATTPGGAPGTAVQDRSAKIVFFEDPRDGRGGGASGNQHV